MKKQIFGYGSLINVESLRATVVGVEDIRPCFVKGFVREFSLWDPIGFSKTNLDAGNIPFCALNLREAGDKSKIVNGVVFEVDELEFDKLFEREKEYELIETKVYDWQTKEEIGTAVLFSSGKNNGKFNFGCEAQKRYLDLCLEGAKSFGDEFYDLFRETTLLDGKRLVDCNV